jgi:hypothetical protein
MAFVAADCFYTPGSRWVFSFIAGCNGEFAVRFNHRIRGRHGSDFHRWLAMVAGVTCWYPGAPAAFMRIAKASPSPGKFVHEYLYKKLPYVIIADPCPPGNCGQLTPCCSGIYVPNNLVATVSNATGGFAGMPAQLALVYGSGSGNWQSGTFVIGGVTFLLILTCDTSGPPTWTLDFEKVPSAPGPPGTLTSASCEPLALAFAFGSAGNGCDIVVII